MNDTATLTQFATATESLRTTRPVSELRRLWLAAADASEALSTIYELPANASNEAACAIAEDRADDTRHALLDYLLMEHGLTSADVKRSVLP